MSALLVIFQLIVLVGSVVIHEVAHGIVAERKGDPTAKNAGRLTLNPLKHVDPFGSVVFPLLMAIASAGNVVFGWAKPVPVDPRNFKDPDRDMAYVAAAGPGSNILLAIIFSVLYRALFFLFPYSAWASLFGELLGVVVIINIALAIFNLVPIPPLDGSNILFSFFPHSLRNFRAALERYGFFILIAFILFGIDLIAPLIIGLYRFLLGI